jgi:Cdc6-like AAA superfamily ATPase
MKNLDDLVRRYLSKDTQYAILVTGKWGSGKTYYYRNTLEEVIRKTPVVSDNVKKYKPVYISLFGIQSIEELQAKIAVDLLIEKLPEGIKRTVNTKSKGFALSTALSKLLIRGIASLKGLGDVFSDVEKAAKQAHKYINTDDLFLCFDDLERKSPKLPIEELTGFINSLVDEAAKVLIICNEEKIEDEMYNEYKEKVVNSTIHFAPDHKKILTDILKKRFGGSKLFRDFASQQFDMLLYVNKQSGYNYRYLIYALDCLCDIYSILKKDVIGSKLTWAKSCEEELNSISRSVITNAVAIKSNLLTADGSDGLDQYQRGLLYTEPFRHKQSLKEIAAGDQIYDRFLKLYFAVPLSYIHFHSVYSFVSGASDFDLSLFEKEFKRKFQLDINVAPHLQVLSQLASPDCLKLSEVRYVELTKQMIEFARACQYNLAQYMTVFYYTTRFFNIPGIEPEAFSDEVIGMMSTFSQSEDKMEKEIDSSLDFRFNGSNNPQIEKIRLYGLQLVTNYEAKKEKQRRASTIQYITTNIEEFYSHYHQDPDFKIAVNHEAILADVDPEEFTQSVLSASPFAVYFITAWMHGRHNSVEYTKEANCLYILKKRTEEWLKGNDSPTMKKHIVNRLLDKLYEIENSHGLPTLA